MNIIVFIKQVPKNDDVALDPQSGNIVRDGIESTINPQDCNAIEAALTIKEQLGGKITAITMGPPQATSVLNWALAMGCDEAILLSDRAFGGADTLATGYVLSEAVRRLGSCDLILCGNKSADAETAQTGPIIAELLDLPDVTSATGLQANSDCIICEKKMGSKLQTIRVKLPALITVQSSINTPRYPKPINILKASKKPLHVWDANLLGCDKSRIGAEGSPSINKRLVLPKLPEVDTCFLSGKPEEVAREYVAILKEKGIL